MNLQEFHSNVQVTDAIAASVEATLRQIGEDPQREGLKKTLAGNDVVSGPRFIRSFV